MTFFGVFVITIVFGIWLVKFVNSFERKQMSKGWKVNDVLILNYSNISSDLKYQLKRINKTPLLTGWNKSKVFIQVGDVVYMEKWSVIDANKSDTWRKNYETCKNYMGQDPTFSPNVIEDDEVKDSSEMIDGHEISTLNETMCQIYLKQALESENYELAEKIKKRLENFN
jgi:hypothetical protein